MNQNYDQVAEMLLEGKLNWRSDAVIALLFFDASFDASNKTVADLTGQRIAGQRIDGKVTVGNQALGLPVAFQKVGAGLEYQVILAQDVGSNVLNLLAFIDVNSDGSPITLQNAGTLIIRPVLPEEPVTGSPATIGVWMRLSA